MQKVSKQSLAMLALSILLAISIALTFTFAGATSKTATGTITFNNDKAMTFLTSENVEVSGESVSFTIAIAADDEGNLQATEDWTNENSIAKVGLTSTSMPSKIAIALSATGNAGKTNASAVYVTLNKTETEELKAGEGIEMAGLINYAIEMANFDSTIEEDSTVTLTFSFVSGA